MTTTTHLERLAAGLTTYERYLAKTFAGCIIRGEAFAPAVGPRRHRVAILAGALAARVERNAPVSAVL